MKKSKLIRPYKKSNASGEVLRVWNGNLPQEWQLEDREFDRLISEVDNIAWIGRTQDAEDRSAFYYAFNDSDYTDVNWMVNHITLREGDMIERGYNVHGVKSFNRNTWIDLIIESDSIEGIFENFDYDLLDFRAELRGKIAHDPSTKDFDVDLYFLKLLDQYRKVQENNDSVLVNGKNQEYPISIETARHFIAFKYAYKCAKKYRYKTITPGEVAKIINNISALFVGSEWYDRRQIPVYVNKNENYDLAKWAPIDERQITSQLEALSTWIAECTNINPIDKAAIAQVEFLRIHPYMDGNGRISRILANFVLMLNGIPTVNIRHVDAERHFKALNKAIEEHRVDDLIEMYHEQVLDSATKISQCLDYIEKNQTPKLPQKEERTR